MISVALSDFIDDELVLSLVSFISMLHTVSMLKLGTIAFIISISEAESLRKSLLLKLKQQQIVATPQ